LTAGLAFGARLAAIPGECRAHDRAIRERDEDLAQWVADEHPRLKRELETIRDRLNAYDLFFSGQHTFEVGREKEWTLLVYRDQERQAQRDVARVRESEGWLHRSWRFFSRRKVVALTAPERVQPVLDSWRLLASRHLGAEETPPPIDDPTRRALDDTLAEVAESTDALT
jgi:hypothetical protein